MPFVIVLFLLILTLHLRSEAAEGTCRRREGLRCHKCQHSYWEVDTDENPSCLDKTRLASGDYLVGCGCDEIYCVLNIVTANGILTKISRGCGNTEHCYSNAMTAAGWLCKSQGFGVDMRTCTKCCNTTGCNHETGMKFYYNATPDNLGLNSIKLPTV